MEDQIENQQPTCIYHTQQKIISVCTKPNCEMQNRLICYKCVINEHKSHLNYLYYLPQSKQPAPQASQFPQYFNNDIILQQTMEIINNLQSEQEIEDIFGNLLSEITGIILSMKNQVIQQYREKLAERKKFIQDLQYRLQQTFDMSQLNNMLNQLFLNQNQQKNKQGKAQDQDTEFIKKKKELNQINQELNAYFKQQMEDPLKTKERKEIYEFMNINQKYNFLCFDKSQYLLMKEKCLRYLEYLKSSFINLYNIQKNFTKFMLIQVKQYHFVKFIDDGYIFQLNGTCLVVSDSPLKSYGTYEFDIQFNQYSSGCIVFGIQTEDQIMSSQYWGGKPAVCVTCSKLDAIKFQLVKGTKYLGQYKKQNCIYKVSLNLEKNQFIVADQGQNSIMQSQDDTIKMKKWRFFIYNYSGVPCELQLINMKYYN